MEDMLWIEDIVESTPTPPFLTNSKVDMVGLVHLHKVVARSAFLVIPSAFIWIYKKSLNWFPFQTKEHQGRRWSW
jgi:hypothetical protein